MKTDVTKKFQVYHTDNCFFFDNTDSVGNITRLTINSDKVITYQRKPVNGNWTWVWTSVLP